jgi:RHS repeat-associated protein
VGTPTHLIDEHGDIHWRNRSTLWGAPVGATSRDRASTPLRFPGQYADEETGWHYNFHRHYDPFIARYTTPDPLGLDPAPNPDTYPHNPHTWIDPLGLAAHPWKLTKEGSSKIMKGGPFKTTFYKSKSDGTWWTPDVTGHGGSKFKVYEETKKGLEWIADADEFGNYMPNKWKGDTGKFVPWSRLRGA